MIGAILGDIVGSRFEFTTRFKTKDFQFITSDCVFTDDSIMTVAIAEALLQLGDIDDVEQFKDIVVMSMRKWGKKYPWAGYGGSFSRWLVIPNPQPYNSWGNGSAMRVSPVGWAFDSLEMTRKYAKASAEVTHNHPEGIMGAEATAAAIFMARTGSSKEEIKEYIVKEFGYDLERTIDEIRPGFEMYESCQQTVPESIIGFLEGNDYEDTVRNVVSLGGDTDTLGAIAGSIAEAFFGIKDEHIAACKEKLDEELLEVIEEFCGKYIK